MALHLHRVPLNAVTVAKEEAEQLVEVVERLHRISAELVAEVFYRVVGEDVQLTGDFTRAVQLVAQDVVAVALGERGSDGGLARVILQRSLSRLWWRSCPTSSARSLSGAPARDV